MTFGEDAHRAPTGTGPAVAAVLRNTAIGVHRGNGETNIARATRRPHDLITTVKQRLPDYAMTPAGHPIGALPLSYAIS